MLNIYVLKSCDTCRKALKHLAAQNIETTIFDIRKDGMSAQTIDNAISALGWEAVLNRRSTSWRALDESQKADIDATKASQLISANPTLMKRPLFYINDTYVVGFDQAAQNKLNDLIANS